MTNQIRIDKTEIENKFGKINSSKGVELKNDFVSDSSTISGWNNCNSMISESDRIRSNLVYSENLHTLNMNMFNGNWSAIDADAANKLLEELYV